MGQNTSAEADPDYSTSSTRRFSKMPPGADAATIAHELQSFGGGARNEELFPQIHAMTPEEITSLRTFLERRIADFRREIDINAEEDNAGFSKIFQDIGNLPMKPATASELHKHLNRYNNIFAYDDTRVKIAPKKINFNSDYINANWVPGERSPRQYIATQGPVPDSFDSFWQMVWESGSNTIVMVTNEVEGGKLKCHRYWPVKDEQNEGKLVYGDDAAPLWVAAAGEVVHPTYVERKFTITQKGETRQIKQLCYTAWPDHGVPTTTKEILHFRSEILRHSPRGPLIIHCSAGVGRTGTMIAIDRFIESTFALRIPNIPGIVSELRNARNYMVQGQFQFMYIYASCMDAMQRMLETLKREAKFRGMTEQERQEAEFIEVNEELKKQTEIFEAMKAKEMGDEKTRPKYTETGGIIPHAKHAEGKPTDDITVATKVPASARKESLLHNTSDEKAVWKERQNVPLTLEEKGYQVMHTAKVGDRMSALTEAQKAWLKKYDDAKTAWQTIQSGEGETFDLNVQLTAIQSRVMSLQTAEESWKARGDGFRSLKEADIRDNLASLAARFQSLQHTLATSESRWKSKGAGMQQKEVGPDRGTRNTMDSIGGLLDRLKSLQHEQEAWVTRKNTAITRYEGKEFFTKDVKGIREGQEQDRQRKEQEEEEREVSRQQREEEERKRRLEREQAEKAEREEAARRANVKDKIRKASEIKKGYDPVSARDEAVAKMDADEAAARAKHEAEEKKKREAEEKARKEEELKKDKASKASKFFSKVKN